MRVSELYGPEGPLFGKEVFIIGSGPSLDLIPAKYLEGKLAILLNDTWQHRPTLGPIAFSNNKGFLAGCKLPYQIVKGRFKWDAGAERPDNHVPWDDPQYYVFSYRNPPWDTVSHFDESVLWREPDFYWNTRGGSGAIFACQFALAAGATAIHLVGCDCCEWNTQVYVKGKKQRKFVKRDFAAYARGLMVMVREAVIHFNGVPILNVGPFPGYGREQQQFPEIIEYWVQRKMLDAK